MRPREHALVEIARVLEASGYRFTAVSPASQRRVAERPSMRWARDLRDVFGWGRPFETDGKIVSEPMLAMLDAAGVLASAGDGAWRSRMRFATLGDLLLAHSDELSNLVPFGPDSYRYVSLLEREVKPARVAADIGCGCGVAGLWLARVGRVTEIIASDINADAMRLAHVNAVVNNLTRVMFVTGDLFEGQPPVLDLIVMNAPCLGAPECLDNDQLGLDLAVRFVTEGLGRLAHGGRLILCTGTPIIGGVDPLRLALARYLNAEGDAIVTRYFELDPDVRGDLLEQPAYADVDRIAAVALVVDRLAASHVRAPLHD